MSAIIKSSSASRISPPAVDAAKPVLGASRGVGQALESPNPDKFPIAIKQRVVDGLICYVVKVGKPGAEFAAENVVSPRQGYLPIRRNSDLTARSMSSYDLHDLHEAAPGIWAPGRIDYEWLKIRNDGASRVLYFAGRSAWRLISPYGGRPSTLSLSNCLTVWM